MQKLTEQGRQRINDLAQRYGVSTDAVMALLQALVNGNGTMAQFNHPELGGSGQWLQGGMTMVGDMFNHGLKAKVDGLCTELSQLLAQQPFVPLPLSSQSQSPGGQQQQQQGGYGSPAGPGRSRPTRGDSSNSNREAMAVLAWLAAARRSACSSPQRRGVPATGGRRTWVSRAGPVPRTTFATPTSPTRGGWPWRSMGT